MLHDAAGNMRSLEDQVSDILMHSAMLHDVALLGGYANQETRTEQLFGLASCSCKVLSEFLLLSHTLTEDNVGTHKDARF